MMLTLDIPANIEAQLQVVAARTGQDVTTFATVALTEAVANAIKTIGLFLLF